MYDKLAKKYGTKSYIEKIQKIVAVPIDIESPREEARKEEKRKADLKKAAKAKIKPIAAKLSKDLKDFAKKYSHKDYSEYYDLKVEEKDHWDRYSAYEFILTSVGEDGKSKYEFIKIELKMNGEQDSLGEPVITWNINGSKDQVFREYSEIEKVLSEKLNKDSIVKATEKKTHESKKAASKEKFKPLINKIKKAMVDLAANYQVKYSNHPTPVGLEFIENKTSGREIAQYTVRYDAQNYILKVYVAHGEKWEPQLHMYTGLKSASEVTSMGIKPVDYKYFEAALSDIKRFLVKK